MIVPPAQQRQNHDPRQGTVHPETTVCRKIQPGEYDQRKDQPGAAAARGCHRVTVSFAGMVHQALAAGVPGGQPGQEKGNQNRSGNLDGRLLRCIIALPRNYSPRTP